jgi:hypothetical protein
MARVWLRLGRARRLANIGRSNYVAYVLWIGVRRGAFAGVRLVGPSFTHIRIAEIRLAQILVTRVGDADVGVWCTGNAGVWFGWIHRRCADVRLEKLWVADVPVAPWAVIRAHVGATGTDVLWAADVRIASARSLRDAPVGAVLTADVGILRRLADVRLRGEVR